jgi:arginine decarboxylase
VAALIPNEVFFTKGIGMHREKLQSYEMALRRAGIAKCNLVNVSSILPPGCRIIRREQGIAKLKAGQITYAVIARNSTNEPNRYVAASIGLAVPADRSTYGYLSEHTSFGENNKKASDYAEDLAATMLATTLGIPFDPDVAWDERKQLYRMSKRLVASRSITQTGRGDKNGKWTTVLAAAIFISDRPEEN